MLRPFPFPFPFAAATIFLVDSAAAAPGRCYCTAVRSQQRAVMFRDDEEKHQRVLRRAGRLGHAPATQEQWLAVHGWPCTGPRGLTYRRQAVFGAGFRVPRSHIVPLLPGTGAQS